MEGRLEAYVIASGLVQGVFFRASTRDAAESRGVRGFVRNLPDGRVEAVLQGEPASVQEVIAFMRQGPPGARVTDLAVTWRPVSERFDGFSIRR